MGSVSRFGRPFLSVLMAGACAAVPNHASAQATDSVAQFRPADIEQLTDYELLARIASTHLEDAARLAAVKRLTAEELSVAADRAQEMESRALLLTSVHIVQAASAVPEEHRARVLSGLMPLAARYSQPLWVSCFGALSTMRIAWQRTSRAYTYPIPIDGESITLTARRCVYSMARH